MPLKWTDQNKASIVLRHFATFLGRDGTGAVTVGLGPDFETGCGALASYVGFSAEVPERQRLVITRQAVVNCWKRDDASPTALISEIEKLQRTYLRKPRSAYVLLTSISIRYFSDLRVRRLLGSCLTFSRLPPSQFKVPDSLGHSSGHHGPPPVGYACLRVRTKARRPEDAASQALSAVDSLRALWNFYLNYRRWRVSFGGLGSAPVNPVVLGPVHTLHSPNGSPAGTGHWWEPSYVQPINALALEDKYLRLRRFETDTRRRISRSRMSRDLEGLLLQYVRALDDRLLSASFLKLWGVLERATASGKASQEVTVRRASFLLKHTDYRRVALDYLRDWRNRIAHEGDESDEAERMVFELKDYVDALLRFLLEHPSEFSSLEEFGNFLDMPTETAVLRERIRKVRLAHRLRS